VIKFKGHSISAEFRGIDKPPEHVVRRLSACGTYATALVGGYASIDEAKAAIDGIVTLTADTITDEQIRELRHETMHRYRCGEDVHEQLQVETAALSPDGGVLGPAGYHARRITREEARARVAEILNARAREAK